MNLTPGIIQLLQSTPYDKIMDSWKDIYGLYEKDVRMAERQLCLHDRFFLLSVMMHRPDVMHPWLYARCREVEANPDGYLDLWSREHYKSTIITFAGIVQEILRDRDMTIGIFSHNKATSRKFLFQIKEELASNSDLKQTFPDVLWGNPEKESPRWSIDGGIIVKRSSTSREGTVEAHGLVDGMPTGSHFKLLVYDDVVTPEAVGTPDQIDKTTNAWALSDNLGARGPDGRLRKWHIGTRYHFSDTYHHMLERGSVKPRIYPATEDGTRESKPVFLTQEAWEEKKRDQPSAILAAQMLQNPAAGNEALFQREWLVFQQIRPATLNIGILCDPASSKKKGADSTAMLVIGVDAAGNKWLLDGLRDKLTLNQRWQALRGLYIKWSRMPGVQSIKVGYEKYGMQSDLEFFELEMRRNGPGFLIEELNWPREGAHSKTDRMQRLEPDFRNGRFMMAEVVSKEEKVDGTHSKRQLALIQAGEGFRVFMPVRRKNYNGDVYSLNKVFLDEYLTVPFAVHDDMVDCASRIYDLEVGTPVILHEQDLEPVAYAD